MTGSNKVWRMPVACLSSVAMLATLGVSALTANAADVEFTFHSNGLNFQSDSFGQDETITVKDQDGDGELDSNEMAIAERELHLNDNNLTADGTQFTGWFTTSQYGVADSAVNPDGSDVTEVWAHYADPNDVYTVKLDSAGYLTDVAQPIKLARSNEGVMDRIADWQVPSTDEVGDGYVMDKSVNNGLGTWMAANNAVDFDNTDMWNTLFAAGNTKTAELKATPVAAYNVIFSHTDFASKPWTLSNPSPNRGQDYSFDVKQGASIKDYGQIPTAKSGDRVVTSWKESTDERAPLVDENTVPEYNVTYKPASADTRYTVTLVYNDGATANKSVFVEPFSAYETETPTRAANGTYEYGFGGWYQDQALKKPFKSGTKINGDITLYAKWNITGVAFTFDPAFGQEKSVTTYFHTGDEFSAPSFTRPGYTLTGWIVDGNPSSLNAVKSWTGAKLTIAADGVVTGVRAGQTKPTKLNDRQFVAQWTLGENLVDVLNNVKAKVTVSKTVNGALEYIKGADQSEFTAESFDAYVDAYQDYMKWEDANTPSSNADYEEAISKLVDAQAKLVQTADTTMYRLYNQYNGDHLYTTNKAEYESLIRIGWTAEGSQFKVVSAANASSKDFGIRVYRLFNPYNSEHLMTTSTSEKDNLISMGWNLDDVVFYAPQGGDTAVTRLFNPYATVGTHLYTTDQSEVDDNVALGWVKDGVIFNAMSL